MVNRGKISGISRITFRKDLYNEGEISTDNLSSYGNIYNKGSLGKVALYKNTDNSLKKIINKGNIAKTILMESMEFEPKQVFNFYLSGKDGNH